MDAYILNFNNYFNRQVKRFDTVDEYLTADSDFDVSKNINFNPADGITTTLTFNTAKDGNYLLIVDPWEYVVVSRWFIMEQKYQRNGQCTLTLRRDVVADFYQETINAPCFIEKAKLLPNDPMIFNSEGMSFNRIKQSETELKDDSGCGWIVGYSQIPDGGITQDSIDYDGTQNYTLVSSLSAWQFYDYSTTSSAAPNRYYNVLQDNASNFVYVRIAKSSTSSKRFITVDLNGEQSSVKFPSTVYQKAYIVNDFENLPALTSLINLVKTSSFKNTLCSALGYEYDTEDFRGLVDGSLIKDSSTGKFYKIHIRTKYNDQLEEQEINQSSGSLYTSVKAAVEDTLSSTVGSSGTPFIFHAMVNSKYIYLEETINLSGDLNVDANANFMEKAQDADYAIFVIPCPKKNESINLFGYEYTYDKSMAMAQLLIRQLQPASSGGNLIDIQLLPFCPFPGYFDTQLNQLAYKHNNVTVGVAYCIKKSSFSINIPMTIQIDDFKISNECDVWRLVSPNYASSYEFNVAKNYGVEAFHVNCTYKPFTPFIDVHPVYKGLYGQDFDDNRGLILAGDFSLPQTGDTWRSYQIQNKNYSNIFDRQMENLDKSNLWGMVSGVGSSVTSIVQSAGMGALSGKGTGGMIIGAAAGIANGVISGARNLVMNAENKDLQKDMYAYNLGTIDSKPNSLVKNSAFDINNKFYVILEYITCTEAERKAFEKKIQYNGMTVMRIGTIDEFLEYGSSFVKGQIIRLENLAEDNHLAGEIYNEIAKGVYF